MRVMVMAWMVLATGILVGCGGDSDRPTAPVSGKVTYGGQPLDHGRVVFIHESGHGTASPIDPDGNYAMEAQVGANAVKIECNDPNAANTVPGRPDMIIPTSLIPGRYSDHMTSGLTFDVKPGGNAEVDFKLEEADHDGKP